MTPPRNCPRCGRDEISHGYSFPPMQGNVECHADGCEAVAVADTEAEAIAIWNAGEWTHRITDRDEDGIPVLTTDGPDTALTCSLCGGSGTHPSSTRPGDECAGCDGRGTFPKTNALKETGTC